MKKLLIEEEKQEEFKIHHEKDINTEELIKIDPNKFKILKIINSLFFVSITLNN
jgi:hypothetical protein